MSLKSARHQAQKAKSRQHLLLGMVLLVVGAIATYYLLPRLRSLSEQVSFPHIHGLAFSSDGEALIVPAHDGFRVYSQGDWSIPEDAPRRDYMGYSAVADGFYSSGHPEPGSLEPNPLGLIKSENLGQSLAIIGFQGESDFHTMAASYYSNALYVLNHAPNSQLASGLHYSLDGGENWQQSAAEGLTAPPIQIAVHPTDPAWVAIASENGLFLSEDYGNTFELLGESQVVTAVSFMLDGTGLLLGGTELHSYGFQTQQFTLLSGPDLENGEWITFVAQNPIDVNRLATATSNVNVFISEGDDAGWQQVVQEGTSTN